MNVSPLRSRFARRLLQASLALALSSVAVHAANEKQNAQNRKNAQEAAPINPLTPEPGLSYIFPAGGMRGSTVTVTLAGTDLRQGTDLLLANPILVSGAGVTAQLVVLDDYTPQKSTATPAAKNAPKPKDTSAEKQAGSLRVALTIAPDAELGEREIRFVNKGGVSNRLRFVVGALPEVKETEPNSASATAQKIAAFPVVINGQVEQEDRDYFRFTAKAGQTLVFNVAARALQPYLADAVPGWFDANLTLFDTAGHKLAAVDDYRFRPDPVLIFPVPKDGDYILLIEDSIYRGRADFVYRITVGELPHISYFYPLGGRRGGKVELALHGVNLPKNSLTLPLAADAAPLSSISVNTGAGRGYNPMPVATGEYLEVTETEPNDTPETATRVAPPVTVNGRIDRPGDADYITFPVRSGDKLVLEIWARRLESPLDSVLTLFDSKGRELAQNDDLVDPARALTTHHADSRLVFTFPATGDYTLRVRDAQGKGGDDYAYRLAIAPLQPDFLLRVAPDNPRVSCGDSVVFTVNALRRDGFTGEIQLAVANLPAGFETRGAVIFADRDEAQFTVTVPPGTPVGLHEMRVSGTAEISGRPVTRGASPAESVMQAFSYTHLVPTDATLLTVMEAGPVTVTADLGPDGVLKVSPNTPKTFVMKTARKTGLRGPVTIAAVKPPPGMFLRQSVIPAEKDEAEITLNVGGQVKVGQRYTLVLTGTLRAGKAGGIATAPAIPVEVVPAPPPEPVPPATPAATPAPTTPPAPNATPAPAPKQP
ncbi:MAG: DVUA0089 family protein [Opitutae bacterium]|nr:DVUA0089 family protein [Opitutae bacterium]